MSPPSFPSLVLATGDHHRSGAPRRRQPPHHPLRHRHDQVHLLRVLPGGLSCGRHRGGEPGRMTVGQRDHPPPLPRGWWGSGEPLRADVSHPGRAPISSSRRRRTRSCFTTRRSCSTTATSGRPRSRPTSRLIICTGDGRVPPPPLLPAPLIKGPGGVLPPPSALGAPAPS